MTAKIGVKIVTNFRILFSASKYCSLAEIIRNPNKKYNKYLGNSHHIPTSPNSHGLNKIPLMARMVGGINKIPKRKVKIERINPRSLPSGLFLT